MHTLRAEAFAYDEAARCLRSLLLKSGIQSELCDDPAMETIVKLRVIGRSQQMLRIDFEREPDHETLVGIVERFKDLLATHDVVLFSDYGKGTLAHISEMIDLANAAKVPVLVDPKGCDYSRYKGAKVITPNRAELAQVIGTWRSESELTNKAESLRHRLGLQGLLLTRSEDGMTLFEQNRVTSVPALAREVTDVTGAGDTVIATLALMIASGIDLLNAMIIANHAGGLVVSKFGTASLCYEELCR